MWKILTFVAIFSCVSTVELGQEVTNRIVNGLLAAENQFPYAMSLQQLGNAQMLATRGHRCGGVLFTLQHALTAASCLFDNINGYLTVINPNQYRVFAGSTLLTNDNSPDRVRSIANFTVHPQYSGPPLYVHDIAIITFISPFRNTVVRPIPLPHTSFDPSAYTLCTVTGWGATNVYETATTALRYANKAIFGNNHCASMYNPSPGVLNILPSMVCAVPHGNVASGCTSDHGNPLICDNTLTGVLIMTDACRLSSYPEVYTRVSNYTAWIRTVSSAPTIFSPGAVLLLVAAVTTLLFH